MPSLIKRIFLVVFFVFFFFGVSLSGPLDNLRIIKQDADLKKKSTAYALFIQGVIYENEGDFENAKKSFYKAIENDSSIYMQLHLMELYVKMRELEDADRLFKEIVKKSPNNKRAYVLKGTIEMIRANTKSAEKYFQKAIDLGENNVTVMLDLARLYAIDRIYDKAASLLDRAIKQDPDNLETLFRSSVIFIKMNSFNRALDVLKKLETLRPDWAEVKVTIAEIYEYQKKYENAIEEYNKILKLYPLKEKIYLRIAALYQKLGKIKEALNTFNVLIDINPSNYVYYIQTALLQYSQGDLEAAIKTLEKARNNDKVKNNSDICYLLGRMYVEEGKLNKAAEQFEKAVLINPHDISSRLQLAYVYENLGKKDKVRSVLEDAYSVFPDNPEVLNFLGYFYANNDIKLEKAYELIEKALEKEPEKGAFLDSMGWVLFKMGKNKEALTYLKRAIEKLPDDPVILEHIGDVYNKMNDKEKALEYWEKSLVKQPKNDKIKEKINKLRKKAGNRG